MCTQGASLPSRVDSSLLPGAWLPNSLESDCGPVGCWWLLTAAMMTDTLPEGCAPCQAPRRALPQPCPQQRRAHVEKGVTAGRVTASHLRGRVPPEALASVQRALCLARVWAVPRQQGAARVCVSGSRPLERSLSGALTAVCAA